MRGARLLVAVLLAALLLLPAGGAAAAPRPTADPAAPTPTAPPVGPPPQGRAPDGSTVGGDRLATRGTVVARGTPPLPDGVGAAGWLVADVDSGAVLAARDPHGRYYPASTLKTLTLLTLAHRLRPDLVVQGTTEDEQIEGSRAGIVAGGNYPVSLLFRALILQSGNDAANALARAAGGAAATVAAMNATAARIGAFDTVAGTPSGLDVAGQSSSPYDLALIFRRLLDDPLTAEVLRTRTAEMPPAAGRPGYQIQSQNRLLTTYPGDLGGKTGFTDAARHTYVTAAERGGRRLVVSLMLTERRPVAETDQAARLLDWGFAVPPGTPGVGRLVDPGEVPVTSPRPSPSATAASPVAPPVAVATAPASGSAAVGTGALALGGAVVVLGAVLAGRRRAVRRRASARSPGRAVRRPPGRARGAAGAAAGGAPAPPRPSPAALPRSAAPPPPEAAPPDPAPPAPAPPEPAPPGPALRRTAPSPGTAEADPPPRS